METNESRDRWLTGLNTECQQGYIFSPRCRRIGHDYIHDPNACALTGYTMQDRGKGKDNQSNMTGVSGVFRTNSMDCFFVMRQSNIRELCFPQFKGNKKAIDFIEMLVTSIGFGAHGAVGS